MRRRAVLAPQAAQERAAALEKQLAAAKSQAGSTDKARQDALARAQSAEQRASEAEARLAEAERKLASGAAEAERKLARALSGRDRAAAEREELRAERDRLAVERDEVLRRAAEQADAAAAQAREAVEAAAEAVEWARGEVAGTALPDAWAAWFAGEGGEALAALRHEALGALVALRGAAGEAREGVRAAAAAARAAVEARAAEVQRRVEAVLGMDRQLASLGPEGLDGLCDQIQQVSSRGGSRNGACWRCCRCRQRQRQPRIHQLGVRGRRRAGPPAGGAPDRAVRAARVGGRRRRQSQVRRLCFEAKPFVHCSCERQLLNGLCALPAGAPAGRRCRRSSRCSAPRWRCSRAPR